MKQLFRHAKFTPTGMDYFGLSDINVLCSILGRWQWKKFGELEQVHVKNDGIGLVYGAIQNIYVRMQLGVTGCMMAAPPGDCVV